MVCMRLANIYHQTVWMKAYKGECEYFLCCCSILWVTMKSDLGSHSCSIASSSLRSTVMNSLLFRRLIRCVETVAFVAVGGNASVFEAIVRLKWKETLFFCCLMLGRPHASGPVCAAWMDLMNGPSWFSVCVGHHGLVGLLCAPSLLYITSVLLLLWLLFGFDRKKIPWKCFREGTVTVSGRKTRLLNLEFYFFGN